MATGTAANLDIIDLVRAKDDAAYFEVTLIVEEEHGPNGYPVVTVQGDFDRVNAILKYWCHDDVRVIRHDAK